MLYLGFTLICLFYFFIHSALATTSVKWHIEERWPYGFRYYRLGYNFIAVAGLLLIIWCYLYLPEGYVLYRPQLLTYAAGALVMVAGLYIMYRGFKGYRLREFLGVEALQGLHTVERLSTDGLNAWVRHPLYSGSILFLGGFVLSQGHFKAALMTVYFILYFIIGAYFEERKLIRQFGEEYRNYQRKVGFLIPKLKKFRQG